MCGHFCTLHNPEQTLPPWVDEPHGVDIQFLLIVCLWDLHKFWRRQKKIIKKYTHKETLWTISLKSYSKKEHNHSFTNKNYFFFYPQMKIVHHKNIGITYMQAHTEDVTRVPIHRILCSYIYSMYYVAISIIGSFKINKWVSQKILKMVIKSLNLVSQKVILRKTICRKNNEKLWRLFVLYVCGLFFPIITFIPSTSTTGGTLWSLIGYTTVKKLLWLWFFFILFLISYFFMLDLYLQIHLSCILRAFPKFPNAHYAANTQQFQNKSIVYSMA